MASKNYFIKIFISCFFLFSCNNENEILITGAFSDHHHFRKKNKLAEEIDKNIRLFREYEDAEWKLIFPSDGKFDTILLNSDNFFEKISIEKKQMDGKGLKEVFVKREYGFPENFMWHIGDATNWGQIHTEVLHEVWNLKEKKIIFSAKSNQKYVHFIQRITNEVIKDSCYCQYDFIADDSGKITIKNLLVDTSSYRPHCKTLKPDHEEGIYVYKNGGFMLQKK